MDEKGGLESVPNGIQHGLGPNFVSLAVPFIEHEGSEAEEETLLIEKSAAAQINGHHEKILHKSSAAQGIINSSNALLGVGLVALPFAVSQTGWVGLVVLLVLGVIFNYTAKRLGDCMDRTGAETYSDIGMEAFGSVGHGLVSTCLYSELFITLCLFLILAGTNLHKIYPVLTIRKWTFISALAVLPTTLLRNLRALAYVSFIGILATALLIGLVLAEGLKSGDLLKSPSSTSVVVKLDTAAVGVGVMVFAYGGHAVFPYVYDSLKRPKAVFPTVMNVTFIVTVLVNGLMSFLGYWLYGAMTNEQITFNLPAGPSRTVALWVIIVNPLTKFALNLNPIALAIEDMMRVSKSKSKGCSRHFLLSIATRICLTGLAAGVAVGVPFFGLVISLAGALLSMMIAAIFPTLCYLKIYWKDIGWHTKALNILIFLGGLTCGLAGSVSSILAIIKSFQHP